MGVAADKLSVLTMAKHYIKEKYDKPGEVYLGIVSRLDAPVSGVLIIARTSKAAARLNKQFRERDTVAKTYWAAVDGRPSADERTLEDWIESDERHRKMRVAKRHSDVAKHAILTYRVLEESGGLNLLEVLPVTGRKHQIRLQLAHHGHAVAGDRKYGSRREFPAGIALHCRRLELEHPVLREHIAFTAPLPPSWGSLPFTHESP